MKWDTARFDAEPMLDSGSWAQIPGQKQEQDDGFVERRTRHGYRLFRGTLEYLGVASMVFTVVVLSLHLWGLI